MAGEQTFGDFTLEWYIAQGFLERGERENEFRLVGAWTVDDTERLIADWKRQQKGLGPRDWGDQ